MTQTLLTTKLYIPPLRPAQVARPRLVVRLNEGLAGKLTLVTAPPGFGKTTLVVEWLKQWQNGSENRPFPAPIQNRQTDRQPHIAWLSLETTDNDPTQFFAYLLAALQNDRPHLGLSLEKLLHAPQPIQGRDFISALVNELTGETRPLILVLDDYHHIVEPVVHDAIALWLAHSPPGAHLVLTSRSEPPLPLARLRSQGQLAEIRATDLRFTEVEAERFFENLLPGSLAPELVDSLTARTEGWAAGLQLAALSLSDRHDAAAFVAGFSGSNRHIIDYLAEEVLLGLPQAVRHFLMQTAVLERFCRPLCQAVYLSGAADDLAGKLPDDSDILTYLERANLFLIALDDRREWFRYHHLFASFLRSRLLKQERSLAPLHRRAARWYEENGFAQEAIEHWLAAEAFAEALPLISRHCEQFWKQGQLVTLLGWLDKIPQATLETDPYLSLFYGWLQLRYPSNLPIVAPLAAAAERRLAEEAVWPPILPGLLAIVKSGLAEYQHHFSEVIVEAQRALALLPAGETTWRSFALVSLGYAYENCDQLDDAAAAYRQAVAISQTDGHTLPGLFNAQARLAELKHFQGHFKKTLAMCRQLIARGNKHGLNQLMSIKEAQLRLVSIFYEWNDLAAAEAQLQQVLREQNVSSIWHPVCHLLQALIHQARGRPDEADEALALAGRLVEAQQLTHIAPGLIRARVQIWGLQGRVDEIAAWLANSEQPVERLPAHAYESQLYQTRAYALWITGRSQEALPLLRGLRRQNEQAGRQAIVIRLLALEALTSPPKMARQRLTAALRLGAPEGYLRTFIDFGEPMARLLRETAVPHDLADYTRRLLAQFTTDPAPVDARPPTPPADNPLSPREITVLRLVAAGLSNREVAAELYISQNTVKTHLQRIYEKLGVTNRRQAAAEAHRRALLTPPS